jgi:hypothetical protein
MRRIAVVLAGLATVICLSAPSLAQQKTVKACQNEWRANKAENQAKGITEKAYVAQCRTGASTAQPNPASTPSPATSPTQSTTTSAPRTISSAPSLAQQKTIKACQNEWRANKAENQAKGITEKAYVAQCRTGASTAQPNPASTPSPATSPRQSTTTSAPRTIQPAPAPVTSAPAAANQYSTEAQAKARCGSDLVVWVNLTSKVYHFAGHKSYGNTKSGAYMCEQDANRAGMRAAKNEKRPS